MRIEKLIAFGIVDADGLVEKGAAGCRPKRIWKLFSYAQAAPQFMAMGEDVRAMPAERET